MKIKLKKAEIETLLNYKSVHKKPKKPNILFRTLLKLVSLPNMLLTGFKAERIGMEKLGKEPKFIDGLRVTDKETIDIVQMVLAGKVNKSLVNFLEMKGGKAMGISGMDGHMIEAEMKDERLGYVGKITKVNVEPIMDLLEKGYIPVVSTIGCDMQGNIYNINADTAASQIAGAIHAESLISMTDIAGILRDKDDPSTLIPMIDIWDAAKLYGEGVISGGMIPKVECCIDAIRLGVKKVFILDGRIPHAILIEMLTDEGAGTMVVGDKKNFQ